MTFAEAIRTDRVPMATLEERYAPVLNLVELLIGVVPNCDRYLEIWPPGFRTYNLMVPNFLNLPASLLAGGVLKDVVGLGMYASSRAASCNYCSAHTCSFALRRGSSTDAITGASRTPFEAATIAAAEALSSDPHEYNGKVADQLRRECSVEEAEWVVMGIAMMGFLNKFMDAMGVELEAEAVGDVSSLIGPTGWSVGQHGWDDDALGHSSGAPPSKDDIRSTMRVFKHAPGAVRLERDWMDSAPKDAVSARRWIDDRYGYDEELLSHMLHAKPRRALAAMLRHNLDPAQSVLGIGMKALGSLIYAQHMNNRWLAQKSIALAAHHGVADEVISVFRDPIDLETVDNLDARTAAVRIASLAASPSPAEVRASDIESVAAALSSDEIVELIVWISVAQLQHRLSLWYGLGGQ